MLFRIPFPFSQAEKPHKTSSEGGGGNSWEFSVGVCCLVLYILTLFQTKSVIFRKIHPFSDLASLGRNYVLITQIRTQTKRFLKMHFEFAYFSFFLVSYSFGIETTNTFTDSLRGGTYPCDLCKGAPAPEDTRGHGKKGVIFVFILLQARPLRYLMFLGHL